MTGPTRKFLVLLLAVLMAGLSAGGTQGGIVVCVAPDGHFALEAAHSQDRCPGRDAVTRHAEHDDSPCEPAGEDACLAEPAPCSDQGLDLSVAPAGRAVTAAPYRPDAPAALPILAATVAVAIPPLCPIAVEHALPPDPPDVVRCVIRLN